MPNAKTTAVLLGALIARCTFGHMSWLAHTGLFENPNPTPFQQHAGLWMLAALAVPALTIGIGLSRRVVLGALIVELSAAVVLGIWEDHGFAPDGSYLPDPPILLLGVVGETVIGLVLAVAVALGVSYTKRKILALSFRRESEGT